ncbi:MAG: DNA polymerase III subunit delta, partial [Pseudomonadota bacterium]|nr:DNA polymerase III subunit delta [Pseudomonadota bacterium]
MATRPEQLAEVLNKGLAPVYLVSGDDTLLVTEACDQIVAAAKQQGFTERSVHHVETGFSWHGLSQDAASMSLFAERKILDVRVASKKLDKEASALLREWVADGSSNPDTVLLLRTDRLQPKQRSSAWFKALEKDGVVVLIWPLSAQEFPRWLQGRLQHKGLDLQTDALSYLAARVEGNLLAAAQEIEKLALQNLPTPISAEALAGCLEDTSRFSSFDLVDAALQGDAGRVHKVLHGLKEEGVSVFAIMGALTSQLRRLDQTRGLPPARARAIQQFMQRSRIPTHQWLAE